MIIVRINYVTLDSFLSRQGYFHYTPVKPDKKHPRVSGEFSGSESREILELTLQECAA